MIKLRQYVESNDVFG